MRRLIWAALVAVATVALVACAGGTPTNPPEESGHTSGLSPVPPSQTTTAEVPSPTQLAGYLVSPADLGPGWTLWNGFADWPDGTPGIIPAEQREIIPQLAMCPSAGADTVALAANLQWQAFTQLHRSTADEFSNMIVAQQLLLADEPTSVATTFSTLRDGRTSCLTENLPSADWEIGLRERLEVPAVGDARFAERSFSFDPGGAQRDTRLILVQSGSVLLLIQVDELLLTPDAVAQLTSADLDALVETMVQRLP